MVNENVLSSHVSGKQLSLDTAINQMEQNEHFGLLQHALNDIIEAQVSLVAVEDNIARFDIACRRR